jgi:hypothetical protein
VIAPAPPEGAASHDQAEGLRQMKLEADAAAVELHRVLNRSLRDDRIDAEEDAQIATACAAVVALLHRLRAGAAALCQRTVGSVRALAPGRRA